MNNDELKKNKGKDIILEFLNNDKNYRDNYASIHQITDQNLLLQIAETTHDEICQGNYKKYDPAEITDYRTVAIKQLTDIDALNQIINGDSEYIGLYVAHVGGWDKTVTYLTSDLRDVARARLVDIEYENEKQTDESLAVRQQVLFERVKNIEPYAFDSIELITDQNILFEIVVTEEPYPSCISLFGKDEEMMEYRIKAINNLIDADLLTKIANDSEDYMGDGAVNNYIRRLARERFDELRYESTVGK